MDMDFYQYFWSVIKFVLPLAFLVISLVIFNTLLLLISIIWLIASLTLTLIAADTKSNLVNSGKF